MSDRAFWFRFGFGLFFNFKAYQVYWKFQNCLYIIRLTANICHSWPPGASAVFKGFFQMHYLALLLWQSTGVLSTVHFSSHLQESRVFKLRDILLSFSNVGDWDGLCLDVPQAYQLSRDVSFLFYVCTSEVVHFESSLPQIELYRP